MADKDKGGAASASAGIAGGGGGDEKLGTSTADTQQFVPVPDFGLVEIDKIDPSTCVVTHLVTAEQVTLRGEWDLVFDEDGMGAVCGIDDSSDDAQAHALSELFAMKVVEGLDKSRYTMSESGVTINVDLRRAKFREGKANMQCGPR